MRNIYTSYICKKCKNEMILITDEIEKNKSHGRYLSCAYCGSKRVIKENETNDLRECMKERRYKRVKGALRQVDG